MTNGTGSRPLGKARVALEYRYFRASAVLAMRRHRARAPPYLVRAGCRLVVTLLCTNQIGTQYPKRGTILLLRRDQLVKPAVGGEQQPTAGIKSGAHNLVPIRLLLNLFTEI